MKWLKDAKPDLVVFQDVFFLSFNLKDGGI